MAEKRAGMVKKYDWEVRPERRGVRRVLVVDVDVTDLQSGTRIRERTKDLSLYGCGVTTQTPFLAGTKVMLKVTYEDKQFVAFGKVMYGRRDIGMGIAFTAIEPKSQKILDDWFAD